MSCARLRAGSSCRIARSCLGATEAALKDMSEKGRLSDYAILHFATLGALTGQVERLAEPGPLPAADRPKQLHMRSSNIMLL